MTEPFKLNVERADEHAEALQTDGSSAIPLSIALDLPAAKAARDAAILDGIRGELEKAGMKRMPDVAGHEVWEHVAGTAHMKVCFMPAGVDDVMELFSGLSIRAEVDRTLKTTQEDAYDGLHNPRDPGDSSSGPDSVGAADFRLSSEGSTGTDDSDGSPAERSGPGTDNGPGGGTDLVPPVSGGPGDSAEG